MSIRVCEICGALVRNQNPATTTCQPECTAIKRGQPVPEPVPFPLCPHCKSPVEEDAETCTTCGDEI